MEWFTEARHVQMERRLDGLINAFAHFRREVMAQLDDLKAAIAAEDAEIGQVLAMLSSELAKVTDLQNQLAAAIAAGSPDLSSLISDVQAQTAAMAAVLPPPA